MPPQAEQAECLGLDSETVHTEQYDDAIAVAEAPRNADVIEPVSNAVLEARPQWAIEACNPSMSCKDQAEPIMETEQPDRYERAVRWLDQAGTAASTPDREDEWRAHID